MIETFEEFEAELKRITPTHLRLKEGTWFSVEVFSTYKNKSITIAFLGDGRNFKSTQQTMTEVYNLLILTIMKYY